MFHEIEIEKWKRRSAFEFFRNFEDPFFNLTANVNVSILRRFCSENNLSFSLASLFCSLYAANRIDEFKIRLIDEKLIQFDRIHATQTILNDDETFSFCYLEYYYDIFEFERNGRAAIEKYKQIKSFDVETERLDLIYCSVIPWVSFTSFKHASRFDNTQTVPRIVSGKWFEESGETKMPHSVEVNHFIMDGFHVGKYFQLLQNKLDDPGGK